MGDRESFHRGDRRKRNFLAKKVRQDREYHPRIVEDKKQKEARHRVTIRNIQEFIDEDQ